MIQRGTSLRQLGKDLRKEADGKALRRQFIKDVKAEVKPIQSKVKSAYQSNPSKRAAESKSQRRSLRAALAKATTIQVSLSGRRAGVRLRVAGKKMPDGEGRLPKIYEHGNSSRGRWRHPVFGDDEVWVTQKATPTFYETVKPGIKPVERRVEKIANDLAKRLTR